ncbi:uncharacterized protein ACN427_011773 isoform 1-T1 [Glossina fuscipes fuscipes]
MLSVQRKLSYFVLIIVCIYLNTSLTSDPENPLIGKCYQCSSSDPKCIEDLANLSKDCSDSSFNRCFTKIDDDGVVTRGCLPKDSTESEGVNYKPCLGDNCNNHTICKMCTEEHEDCFKIDDNNKYNVICDADAQCFSKLINKKVAKGCATSSTCTKDEECVVCTGGICNTGLFPKDRRSCHKCEGQNCDNVTEEMRNYCKNYVKDDHCYTYGDSEQNMQRGCVSDESSNPCPAGGADAKCRTCNDKLNCNDTPYKIHQELKCIKCSYSKDKEQDKNCMDAQNSNKAEACSEKIPFYAKEWCFTHKTSDSFQRGCLYDRMQTEDECNADNGCTTCNDADGCNREKVSSDFTCIACRSDENPKCRNEANTLPGKNCRTESSLDERCFFGTWRNVVIRGCYVDADERMQYVCADKANPQCSVCEKSNCNIKQIPSNANIFYALSLEWLLFITVFYAVVTH